MKRFLRIYMRYCMTAVVLILLFIWLNLMGFFLFAAYTTQRESRDMEFRTNFRKDAEYLIEQTEEGYRLSERGIEYIQNSNVEFLMLLDEKTGEIRYSWHLPKTLERVYDLSDVASFSRWYLQDYPVKVWDTDQGLLVAGSQIGSEIRYSYTWDADSFQIFLLYLPAALITDLAAILVILLVLSRKFHKSLAPIDQGIEQLACGKPVDIHARGLVKEIGENLNQASDLLQKQKTQIERRDHARTEWIAGVSHDIRTPLSMILGYAEDLENEAGLTAKEHRQVQVIREQSIRIRSLIEDLNLTSKLSYQMQPLRMEKYSPASLLRRVVTEFLNQQSEDLHPITLEIDPKLEGIKKEGDVQLLERALRNVIGNCIRHNPKGCRIRICAQLWKGSVALRVADDGCGIPKYVRNSLLEGTEPKEGVHIMGLRIVQQIVRSHGGTFEIGEDGREVVINL